MAAVLAFLFMLASAIAPWSASIPFLIAAWAIPAALPYGPAGGAMSRTHWYKSCDRARRAVGMPELHPHDLRHAAGTLYAQQGATTREIMARLGHRSRAAADRYQHAAARRDAELAAKLQSVAEAALERRKSRSGS